MWNLNTRYPDFVPTALTTMTRRHFIYVANQCKCVIIILFNLNYYFHGHTIQNYCDSLEIVDRVSETQLEVSEIFKIWRFDL